MNKSAIAGLIAVVLIVIAIGGVVFWKQDHPSTAPGQPGATTDTNPATATGNGATGSNTGNAPGKSGAESSPGRAPDTASTANSETNPEPGKGRTASPDRNASAANAGSPAQKYCSADAASDAARIKNVPKLAQDGGIVQIFQHEAALSDPYGCAADYLDKGLNVNAIDPRPDSEHLTGLLFAIKRNDPKMVQFMLDHGADVQERGGPNKIRPYGYAVFLALQNQSTNYNQVIAMLDKASDASTAKSTPKTVIEH